MCNRVIIRRSLNLSRESGASRRRIISFFRNRPELWLTGNVPEVQAAATRQQLPTARYTQITLARNYTKDPKIRDRDRGAENQDRDRRAEDLNLRARMMMIKSRGTSKIG